MLDLNNLLGKYGREFHYEGVKINGKVIGEFQCLVDALTHNKLELARYSGIKSADNVEGDGVKSMLTAVLGLVGPEEISDTLKGLRGYDANELVKTISIELPQASATDVQNLVADIEKDIYSDLQAFVIEDMETEQEDGEETPID